MKESKTNRSCLIQVRVTPEELKSIKQSASHSTSRKFSDYIRKLILGKPITLTYRNQSLDDFMAELIGLKNELNAIGNNYNQLIKRLHSLEQFPELKTWLLINESTRQILVRKISEIKTKIYQINDQWLQ